MEEEIEELCRRRKQWMQISGSREPKPFSGNANRRLDAQKIKCDER